MLPVHDRTVREARKLEIEETWHGLGGSGSRRVTLTRDGAGGLAFEAMGTQHGRGYKGTMEILRRGRIAEERVERLVVRVAALSGHKKEGSGPTATPATSCQRPICGSGSLTVVATTRGGEGAAYTNDLNPCDLHWRHQGRAMDIDVPGVREAALEILALTVDAAKATYGSAGVSFTEESTRQGDPPTK